jgi:hypothetical protein
MEFGAYTLKNYKVTHGMEGNGFTATVYRDNKVRVGEVGDCGDGGGCYFNHGYNNEEVKKLSNYVDSLPPEPCSLGDGEPLEVTLDFFLGMLGEKTYLDRLYKTKCKKKTCYITKDCSDGEFFEINVLFTPLVAKQIRGKHGDNLVEIINERFQAGAK